MSRIFISYKRVDKEKVFKIKDQIEAALGEKCWIDLDGIESDAQFKNEIIKAINECKVLLFMYSKEHLRITDSENDWTMRELSFAKSKDKKHIVIINLDGSPLIDIIAFDYATKQQVDATNSRSVSKLICDMKEWLNDDIGEYVINVANIGCHKDLVQKTICDICNVDIDMVKQKMNKVPFTLFGEYKFEEANRIKSVLEKNGATVSIHSRHKKY